MMEGMASFFFKIERNVVGNGNDRMSSARILLCFVSLRDARNSICLLPYQDLYVHAGDKYFYSVLCSSQITDVI